MGGERNGIRENEPYSVLVELLWITFSDDLIFQGSGSQTGVIDSLGDAERIQGDHKVFRVPGDRQRLCHY